MKEKHPNLKGKEIVQIIFDKATDLCAEEVDKVYRRRGIKKPHPKDRVLKIDKNRSFSYLPMKSETFNSLIS
jgi:hypothetical protein